MPVMIAARLGAHTGAVVNAFVYRMDSLARRSSTGVRASASPYAPSRGLMSSFEIQTMFGRTRGAAPACRAGLAAVPVEFTRTVTRPAVATTAGGELIFRPRRG